MSAAYQCPFLATIIVEMHMSWIIFVSAVTLVAQTPGRVAGKPDFNGIWEANNTANWGLQTHAARPMVGQPGLVAGSQVLAAPVLGLGSIGWVSGGLGGVDGGQTPL